MKFDPNTDKPGVATVNIGGHEQVRNNEGVPAAVGSEIDTMQPGTAFVPQGNRVEAVTNPPYQTPGLGDAPEEMQKEADQIYRRLRKDQYHAETKEDRAAASGTMWKILEETWEKNEKTGKWQRKKKE